MDRRPSAVLTHVLAGRTRHRKRRSYGATLTRAAKRPRVAAAVGASTRLVAQAPLPSDPTTTSRATTPSSQPEHHPRPWPCWRMRGRVTTCRSHPWWIAQRRAGLYRESWAVQPSSAQVRVSPKARTIGPAPAARRLPLRIGTAMLGLFPHPSRANASRPRHTRRSARCGRLGSVAACRLLHSCRAGRYGGLGWLGVTRRARPHRGRRGRRRSGTRPASPDRRAGRGVPGSCEPARSAAVDPGLGGGLAVTELLARVAGSSVTANCPCADQGGRHVDMVVGADHRGRAGIGVWRDPATGPLTARRQRPGHRWRSWWIRPTAWRRGRWVHAQWAPPISQRC
jgi:hypothetical protein